MWYSLLFAVVFTQNVLKIQLVRRDQEATTLVRYFENGFAFSQTETCKVRQQNVFLVRARLSDGSKRFWQLRVSLNMPVRSWYFKLLNKHSKYARERSLNHVPTRFCWVGRFVIPRKRFNFVHFLLWTRFHKNASPAIWARSKAQGSLDTSSTLQNCPFRLLKDCQKWIFRWTNIEYSTPYNTISTF